MDAARKLDKLVVATEGLLESLAEDHGPKIEAVRERLLDSLERTKRAIAEQRRQGAHGDGTRGQLHAEDEGRDEDEDEDEAEETSIGVRDLAGSVNDYVRRHPWLALATGVLVAASAGILATSATKRSFQHGE
jgi:ElaB/YqjD/DUF883 family membrane-anchored ribosome-binding protein